MDFFCKIEGEFNFLVNFFFWSDSFLKGFLCKIEGDLQLFIIFPKNFKGISFVKPGLLLHVLHLL